MRTALTALSLVVLIVTACAASPERSPTMAPAPDEEAAARELLPRIAKALNDGNAEALASLVSDEFEYIVITSDGAAVETRGRQEFLASMRSYFHRYDSVKTNFEATLEAGPFVAIRETVSWHRGDRFGTESSLAVYEIRDGELVRAWYYPAYRMMQALP